MTAPFEKQPPLSFPPDLADPPGPAGRRGALPGRDDRDGEVVSVRLDSQVIAELRRTGFGWQNQINRLLRVVLGLD